MSRCWSIKAVVVVVSLCLLLSVIPAASQVTFSRDWNAGKRALTECPTPVKTVTTICQMLLNEVRSAAVCEMRALLSHRDAETGAEM